MKLKWGHIKYMNIYTELSVSFVGKTMFSLASELAQHFEILLNYLPEASGKLSKKEKGEYCGNVCCTS